MGKDEKKGPEFVSFGKIHRLRRPIVVTEKIDGTNAQIHVTEDGVVRAGSRNRWITPEADNFGFAGWVRDHADELREGLGLGTHYGEWWGSGIQRRYGIAEKRFSLFNVHRWGDASARPACCHVVPTILAGNTPIDEAANTAIALLRSSGSVAAPGFMQPEGIVIFHEHSGHLYKVTLEKDEAPKGGERS
jgi:hypothetical protein